MKGRGVGYLESSVVYAVRNRPVWVMGWEGKGTGTGSDLMDKGGQVR